MTSAMYKGAGGGGEGWVSQRHVLHAIRADSGAVFSVGNRDVLNPQDRSRWPLAAVWHLTNSD